MYRLSPFLVFLVAPALFGCRFEPLAYDENVPELSDAILDRDIVVYGEAVFAYFDDDDNLICELSMDIQGWAEEEEAPPGDIICVGCSENFTLSLAANEDSSCDHTISGAATVAIARSEYFRRSDNPSWIWDNYLASEDHPDEAGAPAFGFLATNWDPRGSADWGERLAIYEAAESSDVEGAVREYYAQGFYIWGTSEGRATWSMTLQLLQ